MTDVLWSNKQKCLDHQLFSASKLGLCYIWISEMSFNAMGKLDGQLVLLRSAGE